MAQAVRLLIDARDQASAKFGKVSQGLSRLGMSSVAASAALAGVAAAAAAASVAVAASVREFANFEQKMANLRALTGKSKEDVHSLGLSIRELAKGSRKDAGEIADGFTIIASKMPQLLDNLDHLSSVGNSVLALAEGSMVSFSDAATVTATVMNVFGVEAKDASKVVNLLAAETQKGSAQLPELTEGLKNVGATAAGLNVPISETISLLSAFDKGAKTGAEGGTALRQVLNKLESSFNTKLKPSVVGGIQAIKNLRAEVEKGLELSTIFDIKQLDNARSILTHIDAAEKLNKVIQGTNTAFEQQAIVNDTLEGAWAGSLSALKDLGIEFGEVFGPSLREVIALMTSFIIEAGKMAQIMKILTPSLGSALMVMNKLSPGILATLQAMQWFNKTFSDANEKIKTFETVLGSASGVLGQTTVAVQNLGSEMDQIVKKSNDFLSNLLKKENTFEALGSSAFSLARKLETPEENLQRLMRQLNKMRGLFPTILSKEAYDEAVIEITESAHRLALEQDSTLRQVHDAWVGAAKGMQGAFENLFLEPTEDGFKNWAKNILQIVKKLVAQILATQLMKLLANSFQPGSFGNDFFNSAATGVNVGVSRSAMHGVAGGSAGSSLFGFKTGSSSSSISPPSKNGGSKPGSITINAPGADGETVARIRAIAGQMVAQSEQNTFRAIKNGYVKYEG